MSSVISSDGIASLFSTAFFVDAELAFFDFAFVDLALVFVDLVALLLEEVFLVDLVAAFLAMLILQILVSTTLRQIRVPRQGKDRENRVVIFNGHEKFRDTVILTD